MDFLSLVKEARSCRRFAENEPLTEKDLDWLLECARLTPSGRNAQELRFVTITKGEICQKLFPLTRWAGALKDSNGPQPGERPTAFIVTLMPEKGGELLCYDAGIACQTIQLAATSKGWGACIILSFDHQKTAELLRIPAGLKPALVVGLGVARETRIIEPMPKDGNYAYWRDAEGNHHVPKRSLDELIVSRY